MFCHSTEFSERSGYENMFQNVNVKLLSNYLVAVALSETM